jgi:hypothetical protein
MIASSLRVETFRRPGDHVLPIRVVEDGGRLVTPQSVYVGHGISRDVGLRSLQPPRRVMNLQPVRHTPMIEVVQTVAFGEKVFERSLAARPGVTPAASLD